LTKLAIFFQSIPFAISLSKNVSFGTVLFFCALIVIIASAIICLQSKKKHKLEKEYKKAKGSLEESMIELESANLQLIASEEELHRQFLEIQEQKEKLRLSKERYKLAIEGAEVGIWEYDVAEKKVYTSKKGKEILGRQDIEGNILTPKQIKEIVLDGDFEELIEKYCRHIDNKTDTIEARIRIRVQKDKYAWVNVRGKALRDESGRALRLAGSITNINKEILAEAKIKKLAYYDALTNLPNRAYFNLIMEEYINESKYEKFAIILIDLDNFKSINDSMGHSFGDEIIDKAAKKIEKHLVNNELLIRFGGDEFVIVVPGVKTNKEIKQMAEDILAEFEMPFYNEDLTFHITLSMGIATYPYDGEKSEELLKHADMALYDVKVNGKNAYKMFSFELDEQFNQRINMERDLRKAIENNEFELYYQPKLDLKMERVYGFEALIRWIHPEKGIISPLDFIPLAEETGLIIPIGEWVIRDVVEQLKKWNSSGLYNMTIALNLSPKQFKGVYLLELFNSIKEDQQIDMSRLEVEITESTALENIDSAIFILEELKKLGVKVALDDFGTGYSSLNYLTQLPIDYIKIDKQFINDTIKQKSGEAIIKSVIELAHACNFKVIAEGVETASQMEFLGKENCDMVQGYYISEPLPVDRAIELAVMKY